jgi:hypothetical protein
MTSDRQTLVVESNASAKRKLMSVRGCVDTPVDVDTAGNADGKRPCVVNGQTVLMRESSLRESLDDALRNLLPWDIDLVIDEPVDEKEEEPEP